MIKKHVLLNFAISATSLLPEGEHELLLMSGRPISEQGIARYAILTKSSKNLAVGKKQRGGTKVQEGMSGTLSFQPNENINLFCQQVGELKSYRGTEPLYPELFAENIKFEYICPICKEVLDQPVQTKCPTRHILCASCLSFSKTMCGPQCPMCRTDLEDPKVFIEPAAFVLQTIISELDFKCPTCSQTVKLHKLPQHEEEGCTPVPPMPTHRVTLNQREPDYSS